MAGLKFLPEARWEVVDKSVVSRESLNRSAKSADERQLTVAADNAPIRVIYGTDRIGAQIANILLHGSYWVIQAVWGEGECDAIEEVTFDDEALPAGTLSIHYAGTAGQTVDPWMVAAFAAKGQTYTDALPGICYSVLKVPTSAIDGFPQITARLRGRKVQALHPFALTDRVTFTRASTRTYFGSDGLLKTAAINEWPLEYDPVTRAPIGRSVWEASTNLITYSNDLSNAAWGKTRVTVESATSPDGNGQCWKIICDGTSDPFVSRAVTPGGGSLANRTFTWHVDLWTDAGQPTEATLFLYDASLGDVGSVGLTLTTTPTRYTITNAFGAGEADTALTARIDLKQTPSAGNYIYARWGQVEEKAFATPYIPTTTATVTRAADVAVMTGANFSDWYNQSEGTFVVEVGSWISGTTASSGWSVSVGVDDGDANFDNAILIRGNATRYFASGGVASSIGESVLPSQYRTAAGVGSVGCAQSVNGSATVSATTPVAGPVGASRLQIGSQNATSYLNGYIRSIAYYPARLSDAELQALSAPGASYLDASVQPTLVLDFVNQVYLIAKTQHTSNPSRVLADFLSNSTFGAGRSVDWASVVTAALANDEVVGNQPRRKIGLTIDTVQDVYQWAATLRTYAGCWLHEGKSGLRLIPDRPAASVASYNHANGDIMAISSMRLRPVTDAPTVMTIRYTDTSVTPWKDAKVTVYAPGAEAGTVPRRESEVALPGIHSKAQAYREAVERLNKLTLSDLSFELVVRDIGIRHEIGDVIDVTHPIGLTAKLMRIVGISGEDGRYRLQLTEYDAAAYSDAVQTEPSSPDTSLPDPGAPVAVTGLTLSEEVFQQQDGTYSSRIRATWTAPDFPASFLAPFIIRVQVGGSVVATGTAAIDATTWASPAVQEGVLHQVDVVTTSRTGASSSAASSTITPAGKSLIPGNVPALNGFEVGGEVRLSWSPAVDLDIWRYEVRYVASAGTWENGTLIDRTDALRLVTKDVPAGTWDFMVKAIDSVGQYSATEARRTITVTLDAAAFLVDSHDFTTPTLSNMTEYSLYRGDPKRRFVTDDNVSWNTKFSNAMNTYTNPLLSYSTTASSLTTESVDFGLTLSGNWRGELSVTNLAGTADSTIELGPNGSSWTSYPMTAKTGARWARAKVAGTSGEVFIVEIPTANIRVDAVPRTEDGNSTSLASGPKTITCSNSYAAVKSIQITPLGTSARSYAIDNIVVGATTTFDVYLFDSGGTQVASNFQWTFNGV